MAVHAGSAQLLTTVAVLASSGKLDSWTHSLPILAGAFVVAAVLGAAPALVAGLGRHYALPTLLLAESWRPAPATGSVASGCCRAA